METKQIIEKMANLWFKEVSSFISNNNELSGKEFIENLEVEFPDLKFTFSIQTKEIILITEV
jgi:hypothetical protein